MTVEIAVSRSLRVFAMLTNIQGNWRLADGKEVRPCGAVREQTEKEQREAEHVHNGKVGS